MIPQISSPIRPAADRRSARATLLGRTALSGALGVLALAAAGLAQAGPTGASIPAGVARAPTITTRGGDTQVKLNQSRTIIDWNTFDIAKGEKLDFLFNSKTGIVLNRVDGPATIDGALNGCVVTCSVIGGNVWIYAANGVIFGPGARVNVGSLLATTTPLASPTDFLSGHGTDFSFQGGEALAKVQVLSGAELAAHGGALALIAPEVDTQAGSSVSAGGTALIGAAQNFLIHFDAGVGGDLDLVDFEVPASVLKDGSVSAAPLSVNGAVAGGSVILAAVSRPSVINAVISLGGVVTATGASAGQGGDIVLTASGAASSVQVQGALAASRSVSLQAPDGGSITVSGQIAARDAAGRGGSIVIGDAGAQSVVLQAGGTLDAASTAAGAQGGAIDVTAHALDVEGAVEASGPAGGGRVRLGGGAHGQDAAIADAETTTIGAGAVIDASATAAGAGGSVTVWSNSATDYSGLILARGGPLGGDGGSAEVSGGRLAFAGLVDLRAPAGATGTLLLDPALVNIVHTSGDGTFDGTGANNGGSNFSVDQIDTELTLSNVVISAGTITFNDAAGAYAFDYPAMSSHTGSLITFNATTAFTFAPGQPISAASGIGLAFNAQGAAFDLLGTAISTTGDAATASGPISVSGTTIGLSGGSLTTDNTAGGGSGAITLQGSGAIALDGVLDSGVGATGGTIALTGATIDQLSGYVHAGALAVTATPPASAIATDAVGLTSPSAGQSNDVTVFAANVVAPTSAGGPTASGAILLNDQAASLTIGQIGAVAGIATNSGEVSLTSAGALAEGGANTISAPTLAFDTTGSATLNNANLVSVLASSTATTGVRFNDAMASGLTVDAADAGSGALSIVNTGALTISGTLGGVGGVGLTSSAGGVSFTGAFTLPAATTVNASGSVDFDSTVDGGFSLATTVGAGGATVFGGAVGGGAPLASLTTTGAATTKASITTSGAIDLNGALTLSPSVGNLVGLTSTVGAVSVTSVRSDTAGTRSLYVSAPSGAFTASGALGAGGALAGFGLTAQTASFQTGDDVGVLAVDLTAPGALTFDNGTNALTLGTVNGLSGVTTDASDARLSGASLHLDAAVDVGPANALTLVSSGLIDQTTALIAQTLSVTAHGAITLGAANQLSRLDGLDTSGNANAKVISNQALEVETAIDAHAGVLTLQGASLQLDPNSALTGASVALKATGGGIVQTGVAATAGGSIATPSLTGSATGAISLTSPNNTISNVGALGATGSDAVGTDGVSLVTASTLTVGGPVTATNGDIALTGVAGLMLTNAITTGFNLTLTTAGQLSSPVDHAGGTYSVAAASFTGGALNPTLGGASDFLIEKTSGDLDIAAIGTRTVGGLLSITVDAGQVTDLMNHALTVGSLAVAGRSVTLGPVTATASGPPAETSVQASVGAVTLDGPVSAAGQPVILTGVGGVSQAPSGAIAASSLSASSTMGAVALGQANVVPTLSELDGATGATFRDTISTPVSVAAVNSGTGALSISNTGAIALTAPVSVGTSATFTSTNGQVGQSAFAPITALQLTVTAGGGVALGAAPNAVDQFALTDTSPSTSTSAGVAFLDTLAATATAGVVRSANGDISLTNTGALHLTGAVTAGTSGMPGTLSVTLTSSAGLVDQTSGGPITAGMLSASGAAGVDLSQAANSVGTLTSLQDTGALDAAGVRFTDALPGALLTVASANGAAGGVTIANPGGLQLTGLVQAGPVTGTQAVTLTADAGAIPSNGGRSVSEVGAGAVTAGHLTASASDGTVGLTSSANHIGQIDSLSGSGGVTLVDDATLLSVVAANAGSGNLSLSNAGALQLTGGMASVTAGAPGGSQSVSLTAGGLVSQASGATIQTQSLSVQGGAGVALTGPNAVAVLTSLTDSGATGAGVSFTSNQSLSVVSANGGRGDVSLASGGDLSLTGVGVGAPGHTVTLDAIGLVSQDATGQVAAATLTGMAGTGFTLASAPNAVSRINAISTTSGALSLSDTVDLQVSGAISAPSVSLSDPLHTITQDPTSAITADTLSASASGGLQLVGANSVGELLSLTNVGPVGVDYVDAGAGPVTVDAVDAGAGALTLQTAGDMVLNGVLSAGASSGAQVATLIAGGAISQAAGSQLTAGVLTGSAGAGGFSLTGQNAFAKLGPLDSTGAVSLVDTAGLEVTAATTAGGALSLTAPSLTLDTSGALLSDSLALTASTGAIILAGDVATTGAAVLNAQGGPLTQTGGTITAGSFQGSAVGGITLIALDTPMLAGLSNSGSGDIAVQLTGGDVSSGPLSNTAGALTVVQPNGALSFTGPVQAEGALNLSATGALAGVSAVSTAAGVTLTGAGVDFTGGGSGLVSGRTDVRVDAGSGDASFGGLASGLGDVTVQGGVIGVAGALNVGRDLVLTGTGFTGNALSPVFAPGTGRDFVLTDTAGGLTFVSLSAPRDLTVTATDPGPGDSAPIVGGGLAAGSGTISLTGTSVSLSGPVTATGGGVSLVATAGGVGLSGAMNTGASPVQLTAAGGVAETGAGAIAAGTLTVDAGAGIALGGPNAVPTIAVLTNSGGGGVLFNDTGPSVTFASVTTGAGDISLSTPDGALILGADLVSPGALSLSAGASLSGGGLTAQGGALSVAAQGVTLTGDGTGATGTRLDAGAGDAVLRNVSAASGDVTILGANIGAGGVTAGGGVDVGGTSAVTLGQITAGGELTLTGASLQFTNGSAGTTATLTGGGAIGFQTLTSVGDLQITAAGALTAGAVASTGGAATLTAASMTLDALSASGGVAATTTTGDLAITTLQAGGDVALQSAGAATLDAATVGGGLTASATGLFKAATLDVTGGTTIAAAALDLGEERTGGDADLTAAGAATLTDLTAGGSLTIQAGGAVTAGALQATLGDATLKVGSLTLDTLGAGHNLSVTAAGDVAATRLSAGSDLAVSAGDGLTANQVVAGGAVSLVAGAGLQVASLTSGAKAALSGQTVALGTGAIGADASVVSAAGTTLGDLDAGGSLSATAGGTLTAQTLTAGLDATLVSGGALQAGTIGVGRNLAVSGGAGVTATTVGVGGDLTLSAAGTAAIAGLTSGPAGDLSLSAQNLVLGSAGGAPTAADVLTTGPQTTVEIATTQNVVIDVTGPARLSTLSAGGAVNLSTSGGDAVAGALTAGGGLNVSAEGGSVMLGVLTLNGGAPAAVIATQDVSLGAGAGVATSGLTLSAPADLLTVSAGRDALISYAGPVSLASVQAGRNVAIMSATDEVTLPALTAGGSATVSGSGLVLGSASVGGSFAGRALAGNASLDTLVAGGDATLAADAGDAALRQVEMTGAVAGARTLSVTAAANAAIGRASDGGASGALTLDAPSRTQVIVASTGTSDGTARVDVTGDAQLTQASSASGEVLVEATGAVIGAPSGPTLFTAAGDLVVNAGGAIDMGGLSSAGGSATVVAGGGLTLASLTANSVTLRASDLTLTGGVDATQACSPTCASPTLSIESRTGPLTVGDAPSGVSFASGGMTIDNGEINRLKGDSVALYAGDTTNAAARGDLQVGDVSLNGGAIKTLSLFAGPADTVSVLGSVVPQTAATGAIVIGAADATTGWTPKSIDVTGALGRGGSGPAAVGTALQSVELNSVQDTLIGEAAFVSAVSKAEASAGGAPEDVINITRGLPTGVQPDPSELNRNIITTGVLTLRSNGFIVGQNTGSIGQQGGILLTNPTHATQVLTLGRASAAANGSATPELIDLSINFYNSAGVLITRQAAAISPGVDIGDLTRTDAYKINGCTIAVAGACTPLPNTIVDVGIDKLVEGVQISTEDPPQIDDPTITAAGNEEIWRGPVCDQAHGRDCR